MGAPFARPYRCGAAGQPSRHPQSLLLPRGAPSRLRARLSSRKVVTSTARHAILHEEGAACTKPDTGHTNCNSSGCSHRNDGRHTVPHLRTLGGECVGAGVRGHTKLRPYHQPGKRSPPPPRITWSSLDYKLPAVAGQWIPANRPPTSVLGLPQLQTNAVLYRKSLHSIMPVMAAGGGGLHH